MSKKLYNVHIGMRFTTNVLIEAENEEEALKTADYYSQSMSISEMEWANTDYDIWEERMTTEKNYCS